MRGAVRAWLAFSLSTLFFGYAFFQRTAPSAILGDLQDEYALDAAALGALAAMYFYSYAIFRLAGVVLDRTGPIPLLAWASASCRRQYRVLPRSTPAALYFGRLLSARPCQWVDQCAAVVTQERAFDGFRQGLTGFGMTARFGVWHARSGTAVRIVSEFGMARRDGSELCLAQASAAVAYLCCG